MYLSPFIFNIIFDIKFLSHAKTLDLYFRDHCPSARYFKTIQFTSKRVQNSFLFIYRFLPSISSLSSRIIVTDSKIPHFPPPLIRPKIRKTLRTRADTATVYKFVFIFILDSVTTSTAVALQGRSTTRHGIYLSMNQSTNLTLAHKTHFSLTNEFRTSFSGPIT